MRNFNKQTCTTLRKEINNALNILAKKHGIAIHAGNARFSDSHITFKLEISAQDENGNTISKEMASLIDHLEVYGLTPEDLNRVITIGSHKCVLSGFNPRAHTRPFIVRDVNTGKEYAVKEQAIISQLKTAG